MEPALRGVEARQMRKLRLSALVGPEAAMRKSRVVNEATARAGTLTAVSSCLSLCCETGAGRGCSAPQLQRA